MLAIWEASKLILPSFLLFLHFGPLGTGVKTVETDVSAKSVTVEADDTVTPAFMLEKLEKVGAHFLVFVVY